MKDFFEKVKSKFMVDNEMDSDYHDDFGEDYLEIDSVVSEKKKSQKISVRPFVIKEFADIKIPLEVLRDGYTITLLNIRELKKTDLIELKRVVNRLKKTCDAIGGDIAGFGEDWLVATPSFAEVYRSKTF
ncbi:MAG: cell division protein SepF [Nanoarchaeota archaeon]|nr:cell division protein SepF [Nanoarchaeota archaeon]